jgi:hypothetical protein
MNVTRKDAQIHNVGPDEDFPGGFEVVLSTPAKDRDGDELAAEDWKTPLPEHITFDTDHGMSVQTTVGSGTPTLEDGKMIVRGTYSSLPRAQDVRTLVKEKHIRTTSVAFISEKVTKDGKTKTMRELLNGAFVAVPSNREAVVLAAKSITEQVKAGSRNSSADMARIQAIHDHALALGASPADDTDAADGATGGKDTGPVETKALARAVDEAQTLLASVDPATLPEAVLKAIALLTTDAVDDAVDTLTNLDEPEESAPAVAEKAAPAAETDALDPQDRLTRFRAAAFLAG